MIIWRKSHVRYLPTKLRRWPSSKLLPTDHLPHIAKNVPTDISAINVCLERRNFGVMGMKSLPGMERFTSHMEWYQWSLWSDLWVGATFCPWNEAIVILIYLSATRLSVDWQTVFTGYNTRRPLRFIIHRSLQVSSLQLHLCYSSLFHLLPS